MNSLLQIRIDKEKKEQAQEVFKNLGMNLTTGINIFLSAVLRERGIPFQLYEEDENSRKLSKETIRNLKAAQKDFKKGDVYTLEEVKAHFGLQGNFLFLALLFLL
ncbi:type II toxin-antitoxin system RelB/DinJ family antitoxin [Candidatus Gracilibacteria bacterium]|nr:type II toxin-antitoxin system RelB/DinJ family antitoxin [Candidatus Gracilibacteria bacterium]